jgi:hypothetical protein
MSTQRSIFSGEFGEILIPDLLTFLDMLGRTGTLELHRGDVTKRIHWNQGEIVFADSTDPGEHIGEYLLRNGWISAEGLKAARAKAKSDADLVKHLIRDGTLRTDLLPKSERSLVLDIVYSIFEWRDGTFRFVVTPEPHSERVVLKTSVSNIIMEGSRRLDEWARIRDVFKTGESYPRRAQGGMPASLQLPPPEQDVLNQVDGRRTVTDIVQAVEHDQFTVLNALLTLSSAGLVTMHAAPAEAAEAPAGAVSTDQHAQMTEILQAFNNIFESLLERVRRIKGDEGATRFAQTLQQPTFQRGGAFAGAAFTPEGRLPAEPVLANVASLPEDERVSKLKGSLDRLLAKQVLMLDTSIPPGEKQAISELIAREKARLGALELSSG